MVRDGPDGAARLSRGTSLYSYATTLTVRLEAPLLSLRGEGTGFCDPKAPLLTTSAAKQRPRASVEGAGEVHSGPSHGLRHRRRSHNGPMPAMAAPEIPHSIPIAPGSGTAGPPAGGPART